MYKTQHAKVVRLEVSIGKELGEDERTIEKFIQDIKEKLKTDPEVGAHNVSVSGAYYLIDGKVCLPDDYDPEQKDRKPGTYPPVWAGGPSESERKAANFVYETEKEQERDFVRVEPTKPRRDPVTGVRPRAPRKDKGVKRGPRKQAVDEVAS